MTNDEIERNFEFIVNQQARFSSDLQRISEAQLRSEATIAQIIQVMDQVAQAQVRLAEAQERADSRIAELAQAQKRADETLAEGNERMNSLIVVVERYFSNGRGGDQ
jgi:hypothetical protein